jgi:CubicO group peptidase (beta-lactamase class C family)
VNKYVPDVTRADEVTIRQVLSHTSGYQDYWPQDYVPPFMLQSVTAQKILDLWAKKPLDFEPGTKWQYSNTNFVIAGLIVEKVAGMPLLQFLGQHVFTPLGMTSIADTNENKLPPTDPAGYLRYGLGPLRPAPKEGKGWMFAAGELAMTASDLAKWDISIMNQSVLKPASYRQLGTEVLLKNGVGTGYGLGVEISSVKGHRQLEHSGEVSGFTAENIVLPDDGIAVIVQVNQDAVGASGQIGRRVRDPLLAQLNPEDEKQRVLAEQIFADLQQGKIDRSRFTNNANAYFDEQALQDYARGLGSLGLPKSFEQKISEGRGGMTFRAYEVKFPDRTLGILVYEMPDGKFEQFQVNMVQ